jgi:hypothetical protein
MAHRLLGVKLMPFVIKMTTPDNNICWVSAAKSFGTRTFGPREKAELFKRQADAHAVIANLPRGVLGGGAVFSVETALP